MTRAQAEESLYRLRRTGRALNAVSATLLICGVEVRTIEGVSAEDFASLLELLADAISRDTQPLECIAASMVNSNNAKGTPIHG